ncbi:hypothetical protein DW748_13240 [Ruminococcus sp. AM28-41]|nr:hypothetical protein DW748_13240 [Ruminococcus sp. AM28-41]
MTKQKILNISSQNKTVILNMFGAFVVKGLSLFLSLFTMPAYIRFFQNQTVLGVWFTIVSVLNWILYFDLGLGNGLRNMLPDAIEKKDDKKVKELISTTYLTMTVLVIALAVLGLLFIPRLNWNNIFNVSVELVDNAVLINCAFIVYFGILLQFIVKLVSSVLYALQQSALVNLMSLTSSTLIVVALVIMPSSSMETNLYTMAYVNVIAMSLPYIIISFWVYGKRLKKAFPSLKSFNKDYVNDIIKIGFSLFWLQIVFMIISSTNEFMISNFTSPDYVVEYQAYYKVFKIGSMVFSLALTPIWSAVTKAQINKNFKWIKKVYKIFLAASFVCLLMELAVVPVLQPLMDIWLGKGTIATSMLAGIVFAFSGTIFVIHNVNTSIGNGISYFKVQMIWMTFAAAIDIPFSYFMVQITGSWIGIVVANVIALLPYEILAPIYTMKKLDAVSGV